MFGFTLYACSALSNRNMVYASWMGPVLCQPAGAGGGFEVAAHTRSRVGDFTGSSPFFSEIGCSPSCSDAGLDVGTLLLRLSLFRFMLSREDGSLSCGCSTSLSPCSMLLTCSMLLRCEYSAHNACGTDHRFRALLKQTGPCSLSTESAASRTAGRLSPYTTVSTSSSGPAPVHIDACQILRLPSPSCAKSGCVLVPATTWRIASPIACAA